MLEEDLCRWEEGVWRRFFRADISVSMASICEEGKGGGGEEEEEEKERRRRVEVLSEATSNGEWGGRRKEKRGRERGWKG